MGGGPDSCEYDHDHDDSSSIRPSPMKEFYSPPESVNDDGVDAGLRLPLVLSGNFLAPAFLGPELSDDDGTPVSSAGGVPTTVVTGRYDIKKAHEPHPCAGAIILFFHQHSPP